MVKQISVFLENKKGRLAEISKTLADNSINIRAMSIADTTDFGIVRFIADNPETAKAVLEKNEYTVVVKDVLAIAVDDEPGGLSKALNVLHEADITIEYLYAFIGTSKGKALVIIKVADEEKTVQVLKKNNIAVIKESELYKL